MTINKKIKKWAKNPTKHYYHIYAKYDLCSINGGSGSSWKEVNKNFYAYDEEHAKYQFYQFAEQNNMLLNFSVDVTYIA